MLRARLLHTALPVRLFVPMHTNLEPMVVTLVRFITIGQELMVFRVGSVRQVIWRRQRAIAPVNEVERYTMQVQEGVLW
jgi:hypothetical protein